MIRAIKFVAVPVEDQDRALLFYTEKLDFEVLTDQPHGDKQRWIELGVPGAETRIVLFGNRKADDKAPSLTFLSQNVVNTFNELRGRGVEFTMEPKTSPWGTFAAFRDSEGNTFGLSSK